MTVLIVDDHTLFRKSLSVCLSTLFPGCTIYDVGDGLEAINFIKKNTVDIVLLDIQMPGMNGLELLQEFSFLLIRPPVLILTMHAERTVLFQALTLGANGIISKGCQLEELKQAIISIIDEGEFNNTQKSELVNYFICHPDCIPNFNLSKRELQVMELVRQGMSNKEIASHLDLSTFTIESYRKSLMAKTKCKTVADLISFSKCLS